MKAESTTRYKNRSLDQTVLFGSLVNVSDDRCNSCENHCFEFVTVTDPC